MKCYLKIYLGLNKIFNKLEHNFVREAQNGNESRKQAQCIQMQ